MHAVLTATGIHFVEDRIVNPVVWGRETVDTAKAAPGRTTTAPVQRTIIGIYANITSPSVLCEYGGIVVNLPSVSYCRV
jgi:hypothetical protein